MLKRRSIIMLVSIQAIILSVQFFMFYPCLQRAASEELPGVDTRGQHNRVKRQVNNEVPQPFPARAQNVHVKGNLLEKPPPEHYEATWESLEKRPIPQWYDDGKIGIFIHWGIFSVPSFVGVGTNGLAEWFWYYWRTGKSDGTFHTKAAIDSVQKFVKENYPPDFKYADLASQFTAEFFDPEHWAEVFQSSGAKYVVLTSKHHDGFTLWPSKKSWNWNSMDVGPHKDLVGDLGKAIRANTDLRYGLYHSIFEWYHPAYLEDKKNGFTTQNFVKDKLHPELKDLVMTYKPDIVWADGDWVAPCKYFNCTEFLAWLYNDSPVRDTVVTNDRWGKEVSCHHGGYLTCSDRYNPGKKQERKWENCMTIDRESWGYRRNAVLKDYYTMEGLLSLLAETISYGGNLLMNIGPTADGRIQPIFEERLRQMGSWLKVNGEGIYATHMWHTPKEGKVKVYYTAKTAPDLVGDVTVYAIVLQWPKDDVLHLAVPVPETNTQVTWLGYNGGAISWQKGTNGGMTLNLPKVSLSEVPCLWAWVFRMTKLHNSDING